MFTEKLTRKHWAEWWIPSVNKLGVFYENYKRNFFLIFNFFLNFYIKKMSACRERYVLTLEYDLDVPEGLPGNWNCCVPCQSRRALL